MLRPSSPTGQRSLRAGSARQSGHRWTISVATADTLVFRLDYPATGAPLPSNVSSASGHCFYTAASVSVFETHLQKHLNEKTASA